MTRTNQILLTVVGFVAAAGAFYMFALKPKRAEVAQLDTQLLTAQTTLDTARQTLKTYQAAKLTYKDTYSSVVRLGKAVPADDDVRSLVVQLDAAAARSKVDFRTIQIGAGGGAAAAGAAGKAVQPLPPGVTVGAAGFPTMPFSFTFTGKFFRLSDFFAQLERFVSVKNQELSVTGRLLTLDSVVLEPDTSGFPNIKAQVGATSYLVAADQGLTGGATAQGPATATPPGAAPGQPASPGATAATTTATSTGGLR